MIFLPLFFGKTPVAQAPRIFSDIRLECWTSVSILRPLFTKTNKTIGLLQKFHYVLPRPSFLTIYNSFVLTLLNYGYIIYDQALFKISRQNEIESIQYNTTLIGVIIGDSTYIFCKEPVYKQLALRRQIAKLFSGLDPLLLISNKNYRLKKSGVFPLKHM